MAYRQPKYTGPRYVPVEVEHESRNKLLIVHNYADTQAILEELSAKMGWAFEKSDVKMDSERPSGPDAVDWCKYVFEGILVIRLLNWDGDYDDLADECDNRFSYTTVAVFEAAAEPTDGGIRLTMLKNAFLDYVTSVKSQDDNTREQYKALLAEEAAEDAVAKAAKAAGEEPPVIVKKRKFN